MRTRNLLILPTVIAAFAGASATASADFQHVVALGETLSSVAAADGLSVSQVAAANGLSADAQLTAGTRLAIPPRGEQPIAIAAPAESPGGSPAAAPDATGGGYLVRPGDTLSAIAARYGVSVSSLAAANAMSVDGVLEAGRTLSVTGAPAAPAAEGMPTGATAQAASSGGAQATSETVSASDIGTIAAENGVSPSLAEAIAYQESGFNNAKVSATGATGVMQIEPGTWRSIAQLGGPALAPASASANVRGGVELLRSLLAQTGGDAAEAAAGYYQGLESVRRHGMYADTQRYVRDVMALQGRFGGG